MGTEPSFGEKACGVSFNPGGNEKLSKIKDAFANVVDILNDYRDEVKQSKDDGGNGERIRMLSVAITEAQTAQMWGVKAVTWN